MFEIGGKALCIKEDNLIENFGLLTNDCPKVNEIVVIDDIYDNYLSLVGYDSYNYRKECFVPLDEIYTIVKKEEEALC